MMQYLKSTSNSEDDFHFGISQKWLDHFFPFHIVFSDQMEIIRLGSSLFPKLPSFKNKTKLNEYCTIEWPRIKFDFENFNKHKYDIFLLKLSCNVDKFYIHLRGEMIFSDTLDIAIFICTPWITEVNQLESLKITVSDFSIFDSTIDFLFLLQTQKKNLEENKNLLSLLKEEKDKLTCINKNLDSIVNERTKDINIINAKLKNEIKNRNKLNKNLSITNIRLTHLIESLSIIIYSATIVNKKIKFNYFSSNAKKMLGYNKSLFLRKKNFFEDLIHKDDKNLFSQYIKILSDSHHNDKYELNYRLCLYDGTYKWFSDNINYYSDKKNQYITGFLLDITDKKNSEIIIEKQKIQLIQSTKLAALGEMAGGIAHEINNPLAVISGKAYRLNKVASSGTLDASMVKSCAESIENIVKRISKITNGLLSFARNNQTDSFSYEPVKSIVEQTLVLCTEKFKNNGTSLQVSDIPNNLKIECQSIQISQVLLNLINNSSDALKNLEEKWIKIDVFDLNDWVSIHVTDSGFGISEEIRGKIMEPFFTSKKIGEGTGLGLSVSLGIVTSHGGKLLLDSECKHTKFIITLPKNQPTKNEKNNELIKISKE